MKQKFLIKKDDEKQVLTISEFAELDKEAFSLLGEETYPSQDIQSAHKKGLEALIKQLRTANMFPIGRYAAQIAEEVMSLYDSDDIDSKEIYFDDMDYLAGTRGAPQRMEEDDSQSVELDDLLDEDDIDTTLDDEIDDISKPIQIADDDSVDMEDED